ncbi:hypothetical protein J5Y04_22970 [Kitasatospora sp. RG8]|uniref:hypothetical protein n=1 Tax=Kitasatospora sp. RG8 TaxID=2820815 RepID=UPI001AE09F52|nr:hypothetical protein [Kitasatospora sp. RG8]MBP0452384.1 hypothetical protein [Kitasatospora sp. RG8]
MRSSSLSLRSASFSGQWTESTTASANTTSRSESTGRRPGPPTPLDMPYFHCAWVSAWEGFSQTAPPSSPRMWTIWLWPGTG